MGCDIHLIVEKRNANGQWERVLPPEKVRDPWLVEQAAKNPDGYYKQRSEVTWFNDRNYNLFAILANVRNSFDFVPISEPRGLPDDLGHDGRRLAGLESKDVLDASVVGEDDDDDDNDIWLGDHSFSWLTVKELLDYDWSREVQEGGWVDPWNYELWRRRRNGRPDSWSGGVSGGRVEHISYREMGHKIDEETLYLKGRNQKQAHSMVVPIRTVFHVR